MDLTKSTPAYELQMKEALGVSLAQPTCAPDGGWLVFLPALHSRPHRGRPYRRRPHPYRWLAQGYERRPPRAPRSIIVHLELVHFRRRLFPWQRPEQREATLRKLKNEMLNGSPDMTEDEFADLKQGDLLKVNGCEEFFLVDSWDDDQVGLLWTITIDCGLPQDR
jgi:hypothetical protein